MIGLVKIIQGARPYVAPVFAANLSTLLRNFQAPAKIVSQFSGQVNRIIRKMIEIRSQGFAYSFDIAKKAIKGENVIISLWDNEISCAHFFANFWNHLIDKGVIIFK